MSLVRVDCGWLIAWIDGEHVVVRGGTLVIDGDTVIYAGGPSDIAVDEVIDARDRIVAPGFVSVHNHAGGSPFDRSFRDDTESRYLKSGLYEFLMPLRYALTEDSVRAAYRASTVEMLKSGITTVMEMTAAYRAADEVFGQFGIRAYVGPYLRTYNWNVRERRLLWDSIGEEAEAALYDEVLHFVESRTDGLVLGFFAPAQVDTCSGELIQRAAADARRLGARLQIHAGQSTVEFREVLERTGMTAIEWLDSLGVLDENLIIGHCIFTDSNSYIDYTYGDDWGHIARSGAAVAHCPQSFVRNGIALESAGRLVRRGIRLAMGVDTSPQSMLTEMRTAAHLSKVVDRDTLSFTARDAYYAATIGGADALGRPDLGRLGPGAKADVLFFRTDTDSMSPLRDPVKSIVYSAVSADVDRVMVDGVTLVQDGHVVGHDEKQIAVDMQLAGELVWQGFDMHTPEGTTAADMAPLSTPMVDAAQLAMERTS